MTATSPSHAIASSAMPAGRADRAALRSRIAEDERGGQPDPRGRREQQQPVAQHREAGPVGEGRAVGVRRVRALGGAPEVARAPQYSGSSHSSGQQQRGRRRPTAAGCGPARAARARTGRGTATPRAAAGPAAMPSANACAVAAGDVALDRPEDEQDQQALGVAEHARCARATGEASSSSAASEPRRDAAEARAEPEGHEERRRGCRRARRRATARARPRRPAARTAR